MDKRFFFITTYDSISAAIIASLLNCHPDIHCSDKNPHKKSVDGLIRESETHEHQYCGNSTYAAHELQNAILAERSKSLLRKINLTVAPELRIHFLILGWLETYKSAEAAFSQIAGASVQEACDEKRVGWIRGALCPVIHQLRLVDYGKERLIHPTRSPSDTPYNIEDIPFKTILEHITRSAAQENVDVEKPLNKLFLLALAKVITQDTQDFLVPGKTISLEKIIQDKNFLIDVVKSLTAKHVIMNAEYLTSLQPRLNELRHFIDELQARTFEPWQTQLLNKYLSINLQTLGFSHLNKPLAEFYKKNGYNLGWQDPKDVAYSKLLSIHLNSNRPTQLSLFFDSIEETTDDLSLVEVLVNIDDHDKAMEEMLKREMGQRKFTIKYLTSPRPASFCDLWKPINKLLVVTDPNAYFLLNISDEMLFATRGWDSILKSYVGFFPDHLFRLRLSRNKFRNYFDRWECSFAQDSIPVTTKKWVEIGGDWNPCFGPDSFQQLIAFYLAREGRYASKNYLRELPVINIQFHGDIPSLGIPKNKIWKLDHDHIQAMQICQSYPMQVEARRRAILLKAHIFAEANQIAHFYLGDDKSNEIIRLINHDNGEVVEEFNYSLNWFAIFFTNQFRKLRFYAYFGGGKEYTRNIIKSFGAYLSATHLRIYQWRMELRGRIKA
jgi:hypothetical protein